MITDTNKALAQWAMEYALKNGCQASRVTIYNGSNSSFEVRDMKIDRLQQASENSMIIQLFIDGRYGSFSTNRINRNELESFIRNGIDTTRLLAEDQARSLPEASLYFKGENDKDLQLMDPEFDHINPDDKLSIAMNACEEMMGKDNRIVSTNSSYSDGKIYKYIIASNGFEGLSENSYFSLTASLSIKGEGDARPESYWYDSSLYLNSLMKKGIGTQALERVLKKLGQKKIASGRYQLLVDNLNSSNLLSPVMDALAGSSIQQKDSFLIDKLNQQVFCPRMTLTDTPHLAKAAGARYFDNEGVATAEIPVFSEGILKNYYIDTYNANKMKVKQTISSPSLLTMKMGAKNKEELITSVDKGILVTGFNGGNCNSSTGDFSYGIEGFLIEKGKITQPVSEMNVTGNMIDLWNNLVEIGNDPLLSSRWRIPSLLFDNVDFSGL